MSEEIEKAKRLLETRFREANEGLSNLSGENKKMSVDAYNLQVERILKAYEMLDKMQERLGK